MDECVHDFEEVDFDGLCVCKNCKIEKVISRVDCGNEWRQNKTSSNSRCQYKSYTDVCTGEDLIKIIKTYDDSDSSVVDDIYDLYQKVIKGDIIRYPFNKSVLFMCANTIYKNKKRKYLELNKMQKHFGLTRKQILNGIKYFNMKISLNNINIEVQNSISVEEYISAICSDLNMNISVELIDIYNKVLTNHKEINHLTPKSIAVAILRFYAKKMNIHTINTNILTMKYSVSDTSMSKVDKILSKALTPDQILLEYNIQRKRARSL